MDVISSLPDDVLGKILSFLPTKQVIPKVLLSKRWRNVFGLVSSLDFDSSDFNPSDFTCWRRFARFVTNVLDRQGNAPVRKLTLKDRSRVEFDVKSLICRVLQRGAVDLDLDIYLYMCKNQQEDLTMSSLIFNNKTLVKLKIGDWYNIILPKHVYLPMLKILHLASVTFNGDHDILGALVSSCPVLEELVFTGNRWSARTLSVSSPSLKKLCIQFDFAMIISLDVPNLVYFELTCAYGNIHQKFKLDSLVEARLNLRVSKSLTQKVRHGNSDFRRSRILNLIKSIESVKVLHLSSDFLKLQLLCQELPVFDNLVRLCIEKNDKKRGWQNLPRLIKNSPNLTTLIFKAGLTRCITTSEEKLSSCLSSCPVKVLEILGYEGTTTELKLVMYFLKNLPCLELVKVSAANDLERPIDMQQLLTLPRASSNCKVQVIA